MSEIDGTITEKSTILIPTSYIPGGKDFFGERYAVLIKRAECEYQCHETSMPKKLSRIELASLRSQPRATPLKSIADKPKMYFPKLVQHSVSPYTMGNDNREKYFIAGYTGFVPRAKQFIDEMKGFKNYREKQINLGRKIGTEVETVKIYHPESGMVPCYTGHIQGAKYKFGKRFGHSTKEAIRNSKQLMKRHQEI
eukprot:gene15818-17413_t